MTTAIKRRRGTTAEHSTFIGLEGEITIDSTKDTVVVHDGATAGGFPLAKENMTGNLTFTDNAKAIFGAGSDLQIYHDGSNSYISDAGTGRLEIRGSTEVRLASASGEAMLRAFENSSVNLYYDNAEKLATTATGIDVTGTVVSDGLTVDGNASFKGTIVNIESANPLLTLKETDTTDLNTNFRSGGGALFIRTGDDTNSVFASRIKVDHATGDISFFEDTGTTAKMVWDASAESLGIGTSNASSVFNQANKLVVGDTTTNNGISIAASTTGNSRLAFIDELTSTAGLSSGGLITYDHTNDQFKFRVTGTDRLTLDSAGNVGIGTTAPYAKTVIAIAPTVTATTVNETADFADQFVIGNSGSSANGDRLPLVFNLGGSTANNISAAILGHREASGWNTALSFWTNGTTSGSEGTDAITERLRIDSAGNLGLGVTPSGWGSGFVSEELGAGMGLMSNGSSHANILQNAYYNGTNWIYRSTNSASRFHIDSGNYKWFTAPSGTAGSAITFSQAMTLDASGRLGIGVTSLTRPLEVAGTPAIFGSAQSVIRAADTRAFAQGVGGGIVFTGNATTGQTDALTNYAAIHAAKTNSTSSDTSGDLVFSTRKTGNNLEERLRIDSSGNVGIGTSSPIGVYSTNLTISGSASVGLFFEDTGYEATGDGLGSISYDGGAFTFGTASRSGTGRTGFSSRAVLDASGNLLVGTPSIFGDGISAMIRGSAGFTTSYFYFNRASTTSAGTVLAFANAGTVVGSVTHTNTSTTYATSSDYRLKEDWQPMTGASERVKALKPVNFAWKADGSRVDGFLAHEAQAVVPEAVTGEKDAVELVDIKDEEGNVTGQEERPVYQGIDQSKLVPLLTAALQEALAKIESLEARLDAANL